MICGFTHGRNWKVEEAGTGEQESPQLHGPKATVGGPPPLPPCQVLTSPQDRPPAPGCPRKGGGQEGMRGHACLPLQSSKARNCQKVKIPFVNKIELFDCETRVHGI